MDALRTMLNVSQRRRLAWLLLKRRAKLTFMFLPERIHHRDFVGTTIAGFVSMFRLAHVALLDRDMLPTTEVERRAVVCSRNRLVRKSRDLPSQAAKHTHNSHPA